jgi:hypothetical protein
VKFCSRVPLQRVDGVPLSHPGCLSVVWDAFVAYALLGMPHIATNQMASGSRTQLILTLCERQRALLGYPSLLWWTRCFGMPTPLRHHPAAEYVAVCGCSVTAGRVTWDRYRSGVNAAGKGAVFNPGSAPAACRWRAAWYLLFVGVKRIGTGPCLDPAGCLGGRCRTLQCPRYGPEGVLGDSGCGWVLLGCFLVAGPCLVGT